MQVIYSLVANTARCTKISSRRAWLRIPSSTLQGMIGRLVQVQLLHLILKMGSEWRKRALEARPFSGPSRGGERVLFACCQEGGGAFTSQGCRLALEWLCVAGFTIHHALEFKLFVCII